MGVQAGPRDRRAGGPIPHSGRRRCPRHRVGRRTLVADAVQPRALVLVDPGDFTVVKKFLLDLDVLHGLARDGEGIWCADRKYQLVVKYDVETGEEIDRNHVPGGLTGPPRPVHQGRRAVVLRRGLPGAPAPVARDRRDRALSLHGRTPLGHQRPGYSGDRPPRQMLRPDGRQDSSESSTPGATRTLDHEKLQALDPPARPDGVFLWVPQAPPKGPRPLWKPRNSTIFVGMTAVVPSS